MEPAPWILQLPTVNASLNGIATLLLMAGGLAILYGKEQLHRRLMLCAFGVSSVFLLSYLIYHFNVGSVPFQGQGLLRWVYFVILIPHILLAAVLVPLVLLSIYFGWHNQREKHRKIVHWSYPIWLYVSISGVIIYWMLYHLELSA